MNYIAEIKAFHDLIQVKQLSTGQIALWYALMYINNKCAWTEWFTVPNLTLELHTGLSRKGIYNARNTLKQHGIIDFKPNGTKATSYKLISLLKITQDATQDCTQKTTQDTTQGTTQNSATLNKRNNTKRNSIDDDNSRPGFVDTYEQEFGQLITPGIFEQLNTFRQDGIPDEVISEAIKRAAANGVFTTKYITAILDSWRKQNVVDLAGVRRVDIEFERRKEKYRNNAGKNKSIESSGDEKPKQSKYPVENIYS